MHSQDRLLVEKNDWKGDYTKGPGAEDNGQSVKIKQEKGVEMLRGSGAGLAFPDQMSSPIAGK